MPTLLAKNAAVLVTMDAARRELRDAGLYAVDGFVRQVGPTSELPGHRRRRPRPHRPHRAARPRQHASPPQPDPDPGVPRRPGRGAVRLAHRAVPGLDAHRRRGLAREHPRRPRGAPALGLHHRLRPHVPLPERQLGRRAGRGGAGDRRALPREPRVDVGGTVEGGPAPGRGGGGRGRHPEGLRARHRPLPRPAAGGDDPGRARPLRAVLRERRPAARVGRARPRAGRAPPHPPRGNPGRGALHARALRNASGRVDGRAGLGRGRRLVRSRCPRERRRDRPLRPLPAAESRTAPARTCGSLPASPR